MATAVTHVDVGEGLEDLAGFAGYERALVLVRMRKHVIGTVRVPVRVGVIGADDIRGAIERDTGLGVRLIQASLNDWLAPNGHHGSPPTWSVVVCTRNRTDLLRGCLDSLVAARVTDGEVIVVDNGPSDDRTRRLCERYPVRYVGTERAGLNRARSLGARLGSGDVIIFTDDDVVVDGRWIPALLEEFAGPRVAAVTGPGLPFELETDAQELFERYGGFGRGFMRKEVDYSTMFPAAAGSVGSGVNMAIRRDAILSLGLFDAELDLGTPAITGGDTYALYRLLVEGHRIVYAPNALVWHVHRRDHAAVREQVHGYGVGVYAYLTKCLVEHRDLQALRVGLSCFRRHHLRQLMRSLFRRPGHLPLGLTFAELRGAMRGPLGYLRGRRAVKARRSELHEVDLMREERDESVRV